MNSIGAQKLLVIPVVVSDYTDEVNDQSLENLNKAFFGSSEDLAYESVASYYEKSSYGRFTLTGEVTPWFNPGYSAKEIATYIDDSVISQGVNDYGTYRILDEAINWVKTTQKDINLMMSHINSYARPKLNDKTPLFVFALLFSKEVASYFGIEHIDPDKINLTQSLLSQR